MEGDVDINPAGPGLTEIGGFILVVGDIINNPAAVANVDIRGDTNIDGTIYTTGYFEIHGGGNDLNINGGIIAGGDVEIRGNGKVYYNTTYMDAIEGLDAQDFPPEIIYWEDLQNPYPL